MPEPWVKISKSRYDQIARATDRVNGMPVTEAPTQNREQPPNNWVRMVVKSVSDDHLVCRLWDGFTEGTVDIKVAKPWDLRKKPFHGKTRTIGSNTFTYNYTSATERTVTKSTSGSETQIIIPQYVATGEVAFKGNEIWAARCDTGVILNEGQSNEERLSIMDANIAGRCWAKKA